MCIPSHVHITRHYHNYYYTKLSNFTSVVVVVVVFLAVVVVRLPSSFSSLLLPPSTLAAGVTFGADFFPSSDWISLVRSSARLFSSSNSCSSSMRLFSLSPLESASSGASAVLVRAPRASLATELGMWAPAAAYMKQEHNMLQFMACYHLL